MHVKLNKGISVETEQFEKLTEGQKACLRLYYARHEIKDIARALEIAPVTVNQRLSVARRHLGVTRSADAARLLAEFERANGLYSPAIYGPTIVEPEGEMAASSPRQARDVWQSDLPMPFPTKRRPINDLHLIHKLAYALVLAALIALIFGGGVTALAGLSQIL